MQPLYSLSDVSVCLAHFSAHADLERTLSSLPTEVEVSVCDDGSALRPQCRAALPIKVSALNPCVPINRAVAVSMRPVIVLTNPGTEIRVGMLERMLSELKPNGYLAAACREGDRWLCHSTFRASEPLPAGAGFHFLAMLERSLWDRAGGFDEDYRDGQGYEDADFLWRLYHAGAHFKILDDVVIEHRRSTTVWPQGGLERNRNLYRAKRRAELDRRCA